MDINKAFPSTYLKAADLDGKTPTVVIKTVKMETVGEDQKLVVYFEKAEKGLVLNKTNANTLADIIGSFNTDDWTGHRVRLITAKVEFQGRRVPAIRIEEFSTKRPAPPPVEEIDDVDTDVQF